MTDEQVQVLINKIRAGDPDAFEPLVTAYEQILYNLCYKMLGNHEDAQDAVQETFIKVYRALSDYRGESRFSTWIYRIACNTCHDFLRRKSKVQVISLYEQQEDGDETELPLSEEGNTPEDLLERKLTRESVIHGLQMLPEEQRTILLLREIQGLSYEEIAEILHLDGGTVRSRIHRARKKLCKWLLENGNIPDFFTSKNQKGGAGT